MNTTPTQTPAAEQTELNLIAAPAAPSTKYARKPRRVKSPTVTTSPAEIPVEEMVTQYRVALVRDSSTAARVKKINLSAPAEFAALVGDMKNLDREQLRAYFFDARNNLIGWEIVSMGTLTASLAHPREIFKGVVLSNAASFILAHNHPSGEPSPSDEDIRLTKRIVQAAHIMGVDLLDHFIVAENGVYSFKTAGQL